MANNNAPIRKGIERLTTSNIYPAPIGASVLKLILAKLLTPMVVAVSSELTIPIAKDWRIGIVNIIIILKATIRKQQEETN